MTYSDLSFFFFFSPCKEKCVSGDPVYWFPIRDQQSRKELSWIFTACCRFISVNGKRHFILATATQRSFLIIVLCGACLGGHSFFCWLWALKSCASFHFIIKRTWEVVLRPGVREILPFPTLFLPPQSPFLGVCTVKSILVIMTSFSPFTHSF